MKSARLIDRDARRLFRLCEVDGRLDETRARQAVRLMIAGQRPGGLAVLSRFQRLVRLDRGRHSAKVESASPMPLEVQAQIESGLTKMYGGGLTIAYTHDPSLIGGVRVTVGSDVYDGTVKGALTALEARFSEPDAAAV
jgi:F-type H+-transporting ATPase subunit delta